MSVWKGDKYTGRWGRFMCRRGWHNFRHMGLLGSGEPCRMGDECRRCYHFVCTDPGHKTHKEITHD